jgi:hypothetical protein
MTIQALVTGALFRASEQKTSKSGRPFWTATIKATGDDATATTTRITFMMTCRFEGLKQ